jgi:enoyl-CoA hydratase
LSAATKEKIMSKEAETAAEPVVLYEKRGAVGIVSINRPDAAGAQSDDVLYGLDAGLTQAMMDDEVGAILLRSNGKHFSSGHDMRIAAWNKPQGDRTRRSNWYPAEGKQSVERLYVREQEIHLALCRRWRESSKPVVAAVQGACIGGGMMVAFSSDIIVASEDAYFSDPLLRMGVPGMEYFTHPFEMPSRVAREFVMRGIKMPAAKAVEYGMINHVVPTDKLFDEALGIANELAEMPRFGMALVKQAFNAVEDIQGKRSSIDMVFALHQVSHAYNLATSTTPMGGATVDQMKKKMADS